MSDRQSGEPPILRVLSSLPIIQSYDFAARYAIPIASLPGQPHQKTRKINDLGITRVLAYVYI